MTFEARTARASKAIFFKGLPIIRDSFDCVYPDDQVFTCCSCGSSYCLDLLHVYATLEFIPGPSGFPYYTMTCRCGGNLWSTREQETAA